MDAFNSLLSKPIPVIDEEMFDLESEYTKRFKCSVPREMIPQSITNDEIKRAIRVCLDKNMDTLLKELGLTFNPSYKY